MAGEAGICGFIVLGCIAAALAFSFTTLAPTEYGLKYNFLFQTVDRDILDQPGLLFVGPFTAIFRYPKTVQTLEFEKATNEILDGRTSDGLPLSLGVSFQYALNPAGIYQLYHQYGSVDAYERVYKLAAMHSITEIATNFTAYQFFNTKQQIASEMTMVLNKYFEEKLYASIQSLQINDDELPDAFTDTVINAATIKQNITKMEKSLDAMRVSLHTDILVAEAQANVTLQSAEGQKHSILQNARADAAIINAFVSAEVGAYGAMVDNLALSGDELIKYIWYDTLSGGGVQKKSSKDMSVMVGVNPNAYVNPATAGKA